MLYQTKSAYISKKDLKVKNIEISLEKKLAQFHPKKIDNLIFSAKRLFFMKSVFVLCL